MSLDLHWLAVAALFLGQCGLFFVILNVLHGIGVPPRKLGRYHLVLLCVFVALSGWIVANATAGPWSNWPWTLRAYALICLATLVVGVPLTTLLRHTRRLPCEIAGRVSEVNLAGMESKESLIGQGKHAWMLRLPGNESFRLRKREWEIGIPNLPAVWDGLSLVHLSDLHFAHCFQRRFFEAVVDEASAWDADIVAFTGDLLDCDSTLEWIVPVLSRLRGDRGTFAILGNHDCLHHPRKIRRAVKHAGFTDLDGRWTQLEIEGANLAIGGTSYPWGPRLDPREMPEADFRLLLSHTPDRFASAVRWGIDLVLAGHNHAGQIRLPLVGPVLMPSRYSRRFDRGFFRAGGTLMYVNQGVAGKHPIRYGGCFPEVTRLVLRVAEPTIPSRSAIRDVGAVNALDVLKTGSRTE